MLQSYAAGQVLRYDEQMQVDKYGGLPEHNLDLDDTEHTEISREEFLAAWNELPSFNRPWGSAM